MDMFDLQVGSTLKMLCKCLIFTSCIFLLTIRTTDSQETVDAPWDNERPTSGSGCDDRRPWHRSAEYLQIKQLIQHLKAIKNSCDNHTKRMDNLDKKDEQFDRRLRQLEEKENNDRDTKCDWLKEMIENRTNVLQMNSNSSQIVNISSLCPGFQNVAQENDLPIIDAVTHFNQDFRHANEIPNIETEMQASRQAFNSLSGVATAQLGNTDLDKRAKTKIQGSNDQNFISTSNNAINTQQQNVQAPNATRGQIRSLSKKMNRMMTRERKKSATIKKLNQKLRRQDAKLRDLGEEFDVLRHNYAEKFDHVINYVDHMTKEAKVVHGIVEELAVTVKYLKRELKELRQRCENCNN